MILILDQIRLVRLAILKLFIVKIIKKNALNACKSSKLRFKNIFISHLYSIPKEINP